MRSELCVNVSQYTNTPFRTTAGRGVVSLTCSLPQFLILICSHYQWGVFGHALSELGSGFVCVLSILHMLYLKETSCRTSYLLII